MILQLKAMELFELKKEDLLLSTNKELLDIELIHGFLSTSYWSPNIPLDTVLNGIKNSLSIGLYKNKSQIGFCRLITDYATFAYLADVFIIESERGFGYGDWMIQSLLKIPELKKLRRWLLATQDAHTLYKKAGWNLLEHPEYFMEIVKKDIYKVNLG